MIDDFNRESLAVEIDPSLPGRPKAPKRSTDDWKNPAAFAHEVGTGPGGRFGCLPVDKQEEIGNDAKES